MNQIERYVTVLNDGYKEPIDYVRGTNAIPIVFNITDYTIPENATGIVVCIKPSGNGVQDTVQISGNEVTITVSDQMFIELGRTELQIAITSGSTTLCTFSWPVMVKQNYTDGDLPQSQNKSTFFDELQQAAQEANAAAENANTAAESANSALSSIESAVSGTVINDSSPSQVTVYSSQKTVELFLQKNGDASDCTATFLSSEKGTISSGDSISTILATIAAWISVLNSSGFSGIYNGLDESSPGYALDARQGTALKELISQIPTVGSKVITVGNSNAQYTGINDAITAAEGMKVSNENPVVIFVYPGEYNEQIILNDVHGLTICGSGKECTTITYNGSYPDCTIHCQGDVTFRSITIENTNQNTYAVHCDPVDTNVTGTLKFYDCAIVGGSNAIGYGSGQNTGLVIDNCVLQSTGTSVLYAHNSSYRKTGQSLIVTNNLFLLSSSSQYVLVLDDAGYSNAQTTSVMSVLFSGNYTNLQGYAKMQFRKNTADPSSNTTYLPEGDSNILFNANSNNNSGIPGLNFNQGSFSFTGFILFPQNADSSGNYAVTIPMPFDTENYTGTITNVTVPGVGEITSQCTLDGFYGWGVNVSTSNSGAAGKVLAVNASFSCK